MLKQPNSRKTRCDVCGGFCGGNKQRGCKFSANDAKRRSNELFGSAVASLPINSATRSL